MYTALMMRPEDNVAVVFATNAGGIIREYCYTKRP